MVVYFSCRERSWERLTMTFLPRRPPLPPVPDTAPCSEENGTQHPGSSIRGPPKAAPRETVLGRPSAASTCDPKAPSHSKSPNGGVSPDPQDGRLCGLLPESPHHPSGCQHPVSACSFQTHPRSRSVASSYSGATAGARSQARGRRCVVAGAARAFQGLGPPPPQGKQRGLRDKYAFGPQGYETVASRHYLN